MRTRRRFDRIRLGMTAAVLTVTALIAPKLGMAQDTPHRPITRGLLVAFEPTATTAQRLAAVLAAGLTPDAAFGSNYVARVLPPATIKAESAQAAVLADAVEVLAQNPVVRVVEPNYIIRPAADPNDASFSSLWALKNTGQSGGTPGADISAITAWETTQGSATIVVAVIDTGVDYTHPDLRDNILKDGAGKVVGYDFAANDADPMDTDGHGTHCAGTIGAVANNSIGIAGVSPTVRIMPLRFIGNDGTGDMAGAIAAIDWARTRGAKVMSNSWGSEGGGSGLLLEAITRARDAGILFVAAAGNGGPDGVGDNNDTGAHYPSDYSLASDNVVSVASSTRIDALSAFSNFGVQSVDIAAPGSDILSTLPGNNYGVYSGTSMATPHVAGAAALAFALNPTLTPAALKSRLRESAVRLPALTGKVASGRLNAAALLQMEGFKVEGRVTHNGAGLVSVTLSGGGRTATTAADGTYALRGLAAGQHSIAAARSGYSFSPVNRTVTVGPDRTGIDFTATTSTVSYEISGRVTEGGVGLGNVAVTGGGTSATTGSTGTYTLTGIAAGTHTVSVSRSGYTFSPASRSITVGPSATNVDFTGSRELFRVTGRITVAGAPMSGASVSAGGTTVVTSADGSYALTGLTGGAFSVSAARSGYRFTPATRSVTVGPDQSAIDFAASPVYQIAGRITRNGVGLSGVTVNAGGRTSSTDAGGQYTLAGLDEGRYTLTPSKSGATFEPANASVIVGPDQTAINFRADTYQISGTVTVNGVGLAGVTVATGTNTITTGSGGIYTLGNLNAGSYEVSVLRSGYTFSPATRTVSVGPSRSSISFSGTLTGYALRGTVRDGATPVQGVTVLAGTRSTTTAADGTYAFTGLAAGNYNVRATATGRLFTPANQSVSLGPDRSGVDFAVAPAPVLQSFTLSATSVKGGKSVTGTVTLATAAAGNVSVALRASLPKSVTVPATVTVTSGATTARFTVRTKTVRNKVNAQVFATLGSVETSAALSIKP